MSITTYELGGLSFVCVHRAANLKGCRNEYACFTSDVTIYATEDSFLALGAELTSAPLQLTVWDWRNFDGYVFVLNDVKFAWAKGDLMYQNDDGTWSFASASLDLLESTAKSTGEQHDN
jgi:hypothetical protein